MRLMTAEGKDNWDKVFADEALLAELKRETLAQSTNAHDLLRDGFKKKWDAEIERRRLIWEQKNRKEREK